MAKNIIILGAGASAQYGAPVMSNFMEKALDLRAQRAFSPEASHALDRIEDVLSELQRASHKSNLDLENIESILTTLEMAEIFEKLPGNNPAEIPDLIVGFRRVITETLLNTIKTPQIPGLTQGQFQEPIPTELTRLTRVICDRNSAVERNDTVLITFNYDLILDLAITSLRINASNLTVNYGFGYEWDKTSLMLLKLHGSLNWFDCDDGVYVSSLSDLRRAIKSLSGIKSAYPELLHLAKEAINSARVAVVDPVSLIVPPSWNKFSSYQKIKPVWVKAAHALSDAEHIHIVGYSLPESDGFFRSLFAIGTIGKTQLRSVSVYDPVGSVESRFRGLLRSSQTQKFYFKSVNSDTAFSQIADAIEEQSLPDKRRRSD